ncbi:hypothetical protein [Brevundimonas sp.]|uniref:hypothetical protein n=1 Tax=Brevundimonas sp. TaxID=1871086 RepID=UPI00272F17A8|nr:hypothetical protein [Brevundimonas sp.]MDP1912036.1 hypothetical protein [Brevundimonas sp.]
MRYVLTAEYGGLYDSTIIRIRWTYDVRAESVRSETTQWAVGGVERATIAAIINAIDRSGSKHWPVWSSRHEQLTVRTDLANEWRVGGGRTGDDAADEVLHSLRALLSPGAKAAIADLC